MSTPIDPIVFAMCLVFTVFMWLVWLTRRDGRPVTFDFKVLGTAARIVVGQQAPDKPDQGGA